ncbi:16061_t:CDS:1, partial [Dentiscutata heterogama]
INSTAPTTNSTIPRINSTVPTTNSTMPRINSTTPTTNSTTPRINSTAPTTQVRLASQILSIATYIKIPISISLTLLKRISQDTQIAVVNKKPQIVIEDVLFNIGSIRCIAKKMRIENS